MKMYGEYKKTTYDWLPSVPAHWDHTTIRSLMQLSDIRCGTRSDLNLLSVYREYGVIKKDSRDDNHNKTSLDISNYKYVDKNFVVMNKMKMWQGSLGISRFEGIVSPAYIVCTLRKDLNSYYLNYLLRSHLFKTFYNRISYGIRVGQWDLRYDDLKKLDLFLPPREEQDQIVRYLDAKVSKINKLIRIKQQQIALLKEKKQAIINQAVTKGLDPNAPMKDSGVAWIGEIPEGWTKGFFTKFVIESADYRGKTPTKVNNGIILLTAKNIRKGYIDYKNSQEYVKITDYNTIMRRGLPQIDDILFTTEAPLGNVALVNNKDIALAQRIIRFRVDKLRLNPIFAMFFMLSDYFQFQLQTLATGSTASGIKASKLNQLIMIIPPLDEQNNICSLLSNNTRLIDAMIAPVEATITHLTEYRTRLISDVVTGKVDVRGIPVPENQDKEEKNAMDDHPWHDMEDEDDYPVEELEENPA